MSDRKGISTKPNNCMYLVVQDTPEIQGNKPTGITP